MRVCGDTAKPSPRPSPKGRGRTSRHFRTVQDQPRCHRRLFLVTAPWGRNGTTEFVEHPLDSRMLRAKFASHRFIEVAIRKYLPLQTVRLRRKIKDPAEENSFRSMRANMRIPDPHQVSIRRAHDAGACDLPSIRRLLLDQFRERFLRSSFNRHGVLLRRSL